MPSSSSPGPSAVQLRSDPHRRDAAGKLARTPRAAKAAAAAAREQRGGRPFRRGQRALFVSFAYLGWFLGPVVVIITALIMVVIFRRQFDSDAGGLADDAGRSCLTRLDAAAAAEQSDPAWSKNRKGASCRQRRGDDPRARHGTRRQRPSVRQTQGHRTRPRRGRSGLAPAGFRRCASTAKGLARRVAASSIARRPSADPMISAA